MPKVSKKRFKNTQTPVEALQAVYITDLRIMLDQAHAREERYLVLLEELAGREAPKLAIVPRTGPHNVLSGDLDANSMNDVATFDETADAEAQKQHDITEKQLESEFQNILNEHEEAHAE